MRKNIIKICLDIIMILLLILMYNKDVISMNFHEISGIIVCGLFIIHKSINYKWIVKITKNFLSKNLSFKTRFEYIIDFLLLISITFIATSGILTSKTILTSIHSNNIFWKTIHPFAAVITLILVGIHMGSHWNFIKKMFLKIIRVPALIKNPLSIICILAILVFGSYNIVTTDFTKWLASPFTTTEHGKGNGQGLHKNELNNKTIENNLTNITTANNSIFENLKVKDKDYANASILSVIARYLSISAVFSVITYWLEKLLSRKKSKANL